MPELIQIEVTPDIAAKIRFLAEEGVFSILTGNAELDFKDGILLKVSTTRVSHAPLSTGTVDIVHITPILQKSA